MDLRGRFIFFISVVFAGSAFGENYNYQFGADAGDEFYNKRDPLFDEETEILIPAPNGIDAKFVTISVTSEEEPQVNTTFGHPFITATITFERAPPPGSYFTVSAKGVIKGLNETSSDAAPVSPCTTPSPNTEANNTASDLAEDDNRETTVPDLDGAVVAVANESAVSNDTAESDSVAQFAAVDGAVSTNESDSAATSAGTEADLASIASESNAASDISAGDTQLSAVPESDSAAEDPSESATPAVENATPTLAAESENLTTELDEAGLSATQLDSDTAAVANENATLNAETESNITASVDVLDDGRRALEPGIVAVNESDSTEPAAANDTAAIEQPLAESTVNVSDSASDVANNIDPASGLAGESGSNLLETPSDIANAPVTESGNASSTNTFDIAAAADTAVDEVVEANTSVLREEAAAPAVEAVESEGEAATLWAEAGATEPALETETTVSDDSNPASTPDSDNVWAASVPDAPALLPDSNFAQAAVAEFANAAQAAVENVLSLPQTSATDSTNTSNPNDASNVEFGSGDGADEELNLSLSLN